MLMRFSVVIPVFNGEKYIERAINSILNQTFPDIELIVVNDGSTDGTDKKIKEILSTNPTKNIIYKTINNSGPSVARNIGIDLAKGDYMCFLDSDDQYDENLFNDLSNVLSGEDICFFGWKEKDFETNRELFSYADKFKYLDKAISGQEAAVLKFEHKIWLCNCNEVYSLNLLKRNNIRYLDGVFSGEDANFIYKCLLCANKVISLCGDYFINYVRGDSLMHSSFSLRCLTEFTASKDLYDFAVGNNFNLKLCDIFFTLYYNSRIYVAKRIAKSLHWFQGIQFIKLCRKYIPKIKKERRLLLSSKEKRENKLFNCKILFFLLYKFFVFKKRK